jgi:anaerobic ribonucleoside-triphosphate reductase
LTPADQQDALASQRSKKRSQRTHREVLRKVGNDAVKTSLLELRAVLARMEAIPRLSQIWEKIDELLAAIYREVANDLGDPGEQHA